MQRSRYPPTQRFHSASLSMGKGGAASPAWKMPPGYATAAASMCLAHPRRQLLTHASIDASASDTQAQALHQHQLPASASPSASPAVNAVANGNGSSMGHADGNHADAHSNGHAHNATAPSTQQKASHHTPHPAPAARHIAPPGSHPSRGKLWGPAGSHQPPRQAPQYPYRQSTPIFQPSQPNRLMGSSPPFHEPTTSGPSSSPGAAPWEAPWEAQRHAQQDLHAGQGPAWAGQAPTWPAQHTPHWQQPQHWHPHPQHPQHPQQSQQSQHPQQHQHTQQHQHPQQHQQHRQGYAPPMAPTSPASVRHLPARGPPGSAPYPPHQHTTPARLPPGSGQTLPPSTPSLRQSAHLPPGASAPMGSPPHAPPLQTSFYSVPYEPTFPPTTGPPQWQHAWQPNLGRGSGPPHAAPTAPPPWNPPAVTLPPPHITPQVLEAGQVLLQSMPGMDASSGAPASDKALLQFVCTLTQQQCWDLLTALVLELNLVTRDGPLRPFLFDTETDGRSWRNNTVIDIHIIDKGSGEEFGTLINPKKRISPLSTEIHHITDEMVADQPTFQQVAAALMAWLYQRFKASGGGRPVLVAHNASFDMSVVGYNLAKLGFQYPTSWACLCTVNLARRLLSNGKRDPNAKVSLEMLARRFDVQFEGHAHRARADVVVLDKVLEQLLQDAFGERDLAEVLAGGQLLDALDSCQKYRDQFFLEVKEQLASDAVAERILDHMLQLDHIVQQHVAAVGGAVPAVKPVVVQRVNKAGQTKPPKSPRTSKEAEESASAVTAATSTLGSTIPAAPAAPAAPSTLTPPLPAGNMGPHIPLSTFPDSPWLVPSASTAAPVEHPPITISPNPHAPGSTSAAPAPAAAAGAADSNSHQHCTAAGPLSMRGLVEALSQRDNGEQVADLKYKLPCPITTISSSDQPPPTTSTASVPAQATEPTASTAAVPIQAPDLEAAAPAQQPTKRIRHKSSAAAAAAQAAQTPALDVQTAQEGALQQQVQPAPAPFGAAAAAAAAAESRAAVSSYLPVSAMPGPPTATPPSSSRHTDPLATIEAVLYGSSRDSQLDDATQWLGAGHGAAGAAGLATDASPSSSVAGAAEDGRSGRKAGRKSTKKAAAADEEVPASVAAADTWWPCADAFVDTAKAFTPKQLEGLRKAGIDTVLRLLMYFPRNYTTYVPQLNPHLPDQDAIVTGTVSFSTINMYRDGVRGELNMRVEIPPGAIDLCIPKPDTEAGPTGDAKHPPFRTVDASPTKYQPPAGVMGNPAIAAFGAAVAGGSINIKTFMQGGAWVHSSLKKLKASFPVGSSVMVRGRFRYTDTMVNYAGPMCTWDTSSPDLINPSTFNPEASLIEAEYAACSPLTPKDFEDAGNRKGLITRALSVIQGQPGSQDPLLMVPGVSELGYMAWATAIAEVHRPSSLESLRQARLRLAFQEMFFMQLHLLLQRQRLLQGPADAMQPAIVHEPEVVAAARAALDFELTGAQQTALTEILDDMRRPRVMYRLLQGDVGSGKTAVAFLAMLATAGSGYQAIMLAPTEILASQHFQKLQALMEAMPLNLRGKLRSAALLTSSTKAKERREILAAVKEGKVSLLLGTHALLFVPEFQNLGLIVFDEQHKFGVRQKEKVSKLPHTFRPHILSMSATPIPRTMALVKYGSMVVSVLYEAPPNRKHVQTHILPDEEPVRQRLYAEIKQELDNGGRVFIVYPLRDPAIDRSISSSSSDDEDAPKRRGRPMEDIRNATEQFEMFCNSRVFGEHKCALLHGTMKSEEKATAIAGFRCGSMPVLICTVVIEVGVDVPEASIMVVEHADRFGLAQLHQLRGRVGRGKKASKCFLFAPPGNSNAVARLSVLEQSNNGFYIADADLQFRGAGHLFGTGTKQSGDLDCSNLCQSEIEQNGDIVEQARAAAAMAVATGPSPQMLAALDAYGFGKTAESDVEQALLGIAV